MKKSIIVIALLFFSGIAYSQTTVTLQDQCNCEVLSGTAVSSPGVTTPSGADAGDIYVNTNTGNIYFWDGNSWELTATDDQQLTGFTFNGATNELTLTLENGGSVNVDLSSLSDTLTDTNTTITSFGIDVTNTNLVITDSDTNTYAVALADIAALVNTDNQTAAEVTYDNTTSGLTATDTQAAIDEVAAGSTDDQNIESLGVDLGTNVLTVGIENGTSQTVDLSHLDDAGTDDQTAAEVTYDNTTSGLTATDTQAAIDEVAAGSTDDQTASEVNITDAGGNFTATEVEGALAELAAGSTDDQNIESLGVDLGTNILTVGIENGTSQTVDLSHLDDAGTDDQTAAEVTYDNTASGLTATDTQAAIDEVAAGSTDDQNIESLSVDLGTNILTVGIENGTSQTVDLSHLDDAGTDDQTAAEVTYDNTTSGLTATNTQAAIDEVAAGSTDDQNIESLGVDVGTNILTVGIENGTSQTVDLSHLDDAGTDDQTASEVNITDAGGNFTATEVEGALAELAAGSTDDQNIESLGVDVGTNVLTVGIENGTSQTVDLSHLDDAGTDDQNIESLGVDVGTNILTVGIENGTSQTVDLSHLDDAGTDDQTAAEVTYDNTASGLTATDTQAAIDEVAAGSTDDQNIESLGVDVGTNILTVGIENGTSQTVDLSHLDDAGTDDQNIESLGVDVGTNILTVGIENGTSQTVDLSHLDDAGTDDQTASEVNITDAGGNFTATEVEGALAELAAGSTDDQNIESLGVDVGTNILTVGIENGTSQTVDLSHLDDAGTDDQTAAEVTYDNTTSGLTATDTQAAIDEVAAGSTDDQNIESLGVDLGTNVLTVGIENGTSQTVDLSHLDDAGTDDQNIESLGVDVGTNILTVGIENGTSQTVDLSHLDDAGTDDQTAAEVTYDNTTSGLTATDTQAAIDEVAAGSTDDQNIESLGVDVGTNILTVGIENGTSQTVDLSHLDDAGTDDQTAAEVTYDNTTSGLTATNTQAAIDEVAAGSTDDQNIQNLGVDLGTNILTVGIENGTSQTVDLSHLDDAGTDDQTASEVNITDAGGNFTATEVEGALAELAAGSTDDQNIESLGVDIGTNILTVGIENGTSQTVDLSHLDDAGTDDQTAAEVTYDNTTSGLTATDTQAAIDEVAAGSTDDQNIESLGVDVGTNILTVGIENGTSQTVDLSHLDDAGTDNQIVDNFSIVGGELNLSLEDDGVAPSTVDLISANANNDISAGTDGGLYLNVASVSISETITTLTDNLDGTYTYTSENGTPTTFTGTDDQTASEVNITDAGGNFTATEVEGALAELAAGSTDDQNIESLGVDASTNILTVGIENGTSQTVDLSHLDDAGTDDQTASEVNITDAGGNFTATEVEGALAELAAGSTDDQNIESLGVDVGTNILTVGIENGTSQTVDLSHLDDAGTDDQTAAEVTYDNTTSGLTATDTQAAIDEVAAESTDDQNIESLGVDVGTNILTVGIENGTSQTVDLSHLDDAGTDDQNIESLGVDVGTNILTVGIENGTSQTVDLSHLDDTGTDDQTAAEVTYDNTTSGLTATDTQAAIDEVAAGSTDDQNIESLGVDVGTNILTVGIENGTSQTVDLSHLDDAGTDDQTASEVNITDAGGNFTATEVEGALAELAAGSTDDQNIESLGVDIGTNILTVGIENGTSQTVDLSHLDDAGTDDQTAAEVTYDNTTSGLTATDTQAAIDEVAAGSTDDQNIESLGVDVGTNILTVGIENGTSQTVDLSHLDDAGTDDQNIESLGVDLGTNILTVGIENGTSQTVDLSHLDDAGTDDQNIESLGVDVGTNILTVGIENGTSQTVDLSHLDDAGTDDQTAAEVTYDNTTSGLTATDTQAAIDEVAAGSTDDQNIESLGVDVGTNILTVGIENGTSQTVDLSHLDDAGTDDQTASEVNITDAGGNFTATEVEGALAELAAGSTDDQNIESLGVDIGTNILTVGIENGTSQTVDLSHLDDAGTDDQTAAEVTYDNTTSGLTATDTQAAIDEVAAGSTDDQNIESLGVDVGTNILTVGIENGTSQTVDLSHLDDAGTDDQTASEVNITDAGGNFTATEVEGALAELAAGSTDDQNIESLGVDIGTNILTVGIENGTSQTVDLSHLDDAGTDDQTAAEVTYDNTTSGLTATDTQAAIDEVAAGSTDDQNIESLGVDVGTNILTVGIENGTSQTVDLSHLDDAGTDDQNIESLGVDLGTNILTVGIENGTSQTVDLSHLDDAGTDDQNIESLGVDVGTNILTVGIENGTSQTVDLSHLDDAGTDDQTASEVNITDAGGNFTATEVEGALAELAAGSTDDQNIESLGVDIGTNILTVGIENGTSQTVDLSHLDDAGTDDQTAAEVTYDNTTSGLTATDTQAAIDEVAAGSTDDQNIESLGVDVGTNILTVGIENGTSQTVDLSHLDDAGTDDQTASEVNITDAGGNFTATEVEGALAELAAGSTDDQNIESLGVDVGTNILTVGIENGTSQTVDLSHLDDAGTDDQTASEVNITDAGGNFTATEVEGALAELAAGSTDDQNIESLGVDLGTNILTVGIENGTSQTVDLSHLDDAGTDDQTAAEVTYDNTASGLTATDTQAAIDEVAAGSTDDQNIESLGVDVGTNVLTVGIENGTSQTVDLSHLDDAGTDDQNIESLGVDVGTNVLTVGIENGTSQTVDLSHLDDAGTDDQTASEVNITDAGGNFTATEVEGALAELAAGSTDDQNIESLGVDVGTNILTVGIENGTSQTVDLSHLDDAGTDDQTASEVNITDAGGNFTATEVEGALAELAAGSTDDQNIESLGVDIGTNILTVGIENGTSQTVDLSHLDDAGTDDQTAAEVTYDNTTSGLTATDTQAAIDEVAAGSTDDQNIESLGVDVGTNILTVGIENGTSQTVDLSHLDDAGTDDQTASEVNITDAGGNFTATEVEGALAELAAGSTDDQNIESLGVDVGTNILTVGIENGTSQTVDLSHLDDAGTDDQTASEVNITDAGGNFTATEVEGALAELAAGSTDDQNIESLGVDLGTNILTVGIENGTSQTVDLSHLDDAGTDDQTASEVNITDSGGNFTATEVEGALAELAAGSTDDQNIESLGVDLGTNILTVGIENGTSQTVDLSHLDDAGTDDQTAAEVTYDNTTSGLTATDTQAAIDEVAAGSTDDQNIESLGVDLGTNILTVGIENGTSQTVDLSHLDDAGTDDQNIESLGIDVGTNILTVGIENGTSQTVDLSHLDDAGTDDQTASEVNITDAGGNFTATEVEGALAELAAQTDDDVSVTNTVAGNRIATISEPGIVSVDINETVTSLTQNTTTGVISYTDEDGGAAETANVVSTDANNELTVGADGGASFEMTDIDVDGDGAAETTVDEAMADIAKITATAGRIFYPPSIAVDASTTGIKNIDLYQEYLDQFGTPTAGSSGAPVAIPTYARTDLYYYVTYADPTVFETDSGDPNFMTIDANGNLTIEVENLPTDYNSLINVVFVVK